MATPSAHRQAHGSRCPAQQTKSVSAATAPPGSSAAPRQPAATASTTGPAAPGAPPPEERYASTSTAPATPGSSTTSAPSTDGRVDCCTGSVTITLEHSEHAQRLLLIAPD